MYKYIFKLGPMKIQIYLLSRAVEYVHVNRTAGHLEVIM